jgi:chromosome partitioning protein
MHTIVLATQKGGSGKSTLAIGLALAAKQGGHIVRLIETDAQGTLSKWQSRRGLAEPIVETVYGPGDIEPRLQSLERGGVTLTIVDTAGGQSAATTAAIRHCDLCIIPSRPSLADIEATASTLHVARAWKKPFAFVLNQTPTRGQRIEAAESTLGEEVALDIPDVLAQPCIAMRNDHQDALRAGLAVSEHAPSGKSADEIRGLWQWVEARLNGGIAPGEQRAGEPGETRFPIELIPTPAEQLAAPSAAAALPAVRTEADASWDRACSRIQRMIDDHHAADSGGRPLLAFENLTRSISPIPAHTRHRAGFNGRG